MKTNKAKNEDNAVSLQHPIQFRLPRQKEVDPWFGANRSWWNVHILPSTLNDFDPPIKSRVVRREGAKKAVRFILWSSAVAFFQKIDETTAEELRELRQQNGIKQ